MMGMDMHQMVHLYGTNGSARAVILGSKLSMKNTITVRIADNIFYGRKEMNDRYLYRAKRTDNGEWCNDEVIGNIFDNTELLEVGE